MVCGGCVLAADAAQQHLALEHLASPMGVYPCAQVRMSDESTAGMLAVQTGKKPPWSLTPMK